MKKLIEIPDTLLPRISTRAESLGLNMTAYIRMLIYADVNNVSSAVNPIPGNGKNWSDLPGMNIPSKVKTALDCVADARSADFTPLGGGEKNVAETYLDDDSHGLEEREVKLEFQPPKKMSRKKVVEGEGDLERKYFIDETFETNTIPQHKFPEDKKEYFTKLEGSDEYYTVPEAEVDALKNPPKKSSAKKGCETKKKFNLESTEAEALKNLDKIAEDTIMRGEPTTKLDVAAMVEKQKKNTEKIAKKKPKK